MPVPISHTKHPSVLLTADMQMRSVPKPSREVIIMKMMQLASKHYGIMSCQQQILHSTDVCMPQSWERNEMFSVLMPMKIWARA